MVDVKRTPKKELAHQIMQLFGRLEIFGKYKRLGLQTKIGLRLYEYRVVNFLHITIVLKHAA